MKQSSFVGSICIIFAAMIWAFDGIFLTPSLFHLDVIIVVFLLHTIPLIYMIWFLWYDRQNIFKMKKGDWFSICIVALFGGVIGTLAITKALFFVNFVPLTVVVLLQKLQPVFCVLLAIIFLREKPKKIFYLYSLLAFIGSYFVAFGFSLPRFDVGNKIFLASCFSILAAFAFGSSTVFSKKALNHINFRVATVLRFFLTSIFLGICILLLWKFSSFDLITNRDWGFFGIISIVGGIAIGMYYYGLKNVTATKSTMLELSLPLTAILLEYLIRGVVLSLGQWLGTIILLSSIIKISLMETEASIENR